MKSIGILRIVLTGSLLMCCGCPQYADPTVPNPVLSVHEPESSRRYLLYIPTGYEADEAVPLVILAHGTTPWDSPRRQMGDWVKMAEEENFIVQREDERSILAVTRHIRAAYSISESRMFLCGWSAGGYAVLYTGLRNPETFRALAVLQGNFKPAYFTDVADEIDPYQPVFLLRGTTDLLLGGQGRECLRWLYDHDAYVFDAEVPGAHRGHPRMAHDFFRRVIREIPWLSIRAFEEDPYNPRTVMFNIRGSFEPEQYEWSFGDENTSPVARPVHTYAEDGQYTVTLIATGANGKRVQRKTVVQVPLPPIRHHLDH
jgi:predicted esterase